MYNILKSTGYTEQDVNIIRGEGEFLYDDRGKRYIDFEAGVWSTSLGHSHPRVNSVIKEQVERIMHLNYQYRNPIVEGAAARVLETVGLTEGKCIFLGSGSEAVEFGVQSIRRLSGKPMLLSLAGAYLAAYGSAGRRSTEEWHLFDWSGCAGCSKGECGDECGSFMKIPFGEIGGFVFEPGNSSGLVKLPPAKLVKAIAGKLRQQGGTIMANEVTTGFGRTGRWFGYEHYGLLPDIVAMGKSIGNGYPVSAVAMSRDIAARLEESGLRYAQSHQNDALGCAVAAEIIKVIREEGLIMKAAATGERFKKGLDQLAGLHDCIGEIRGRGLMLVVEFRRDCSLSLEAVHDRLFEGGFLTGYNIAGNLIRFYPALIINDGSIDEMIEKLDFLLK